MTFVVLPCLQKVDIKADLHPQFCPKTGAALSRARGGWPAWLAALLLLAGGIARGAVVINEIHYAPAIKTEPVEFVELYNAGSNTVDITSWKLNGGIQFAFTNKIALPPDAYLVIAQDPAVLQAKFGVTNVAGPWQGRLSNESDEVILQNGQGDMVDDVAYQLGFPWPTVGDFPGHSIELVHPGLDNSLGGSWRASTVGSTPIPGLTIIPTGSNWKYFKGLSEASTPATAWRSRTFDDSEWATGAGPIGFGETSIATVLDDMQSHYTAVFFRKEFVLESAQVPDLMMDLLIDDGLKAWINGTEFLSFNVGDRAVPFNATATSSIEFGGYLSVPLLLGNGVLRAGTNVLAVQVHNASLANADFAFDLGLRTQPGIDPRGATPGAKNSVYADNAPPQGRQVNHQPEQPRSGQAVQITAKVTDPDGVASVELQYQPNPPGGYLELSDPEYEQRWVSLPMKDTGVGADLFPGDAIYSAEIPGAIQAHRHLVRYRIVVADQGARKATLPDAGEPEPNFAYFVYDGVPAWSGAIQPKGTLPERNTPVTFGTNVMERLPIYHLISKKESVREATWPTGNEQYWGDQYLWKGTLVYDGRVYDHIGYRARGGSWRYAMGKNMWKFDFNRGHDFEPRDNYGRKYDVPWRKLNLGACIQQGDYQHRGEQGMFESVGFRLFNLAGVEAPETHFVQLRIVDEAEENNTTNQYAGDFWGLYLAVEQEDGRFLDEHGLPDGNFYKMENGTGELNNQGPTSPADKSDLDSFMSAYRGPTLPESWWRENFDLERYYSYQAIVQGIHHYDICAGKNYFYFSDPVTRLWSVHPWDIDLTWANNMYDSGCGGTDEFRTRVLNRPAFKLEYQTRVREIRDLLFNTNQAWRLIDEYAAMIDDPAGGPAFVDADRAMWDYNPVMADSRIVLTSKAGQGRFYQAVPTKDFPGMVNKMKNYVVTRAALLDNLASDPLIPETPLVRSMTASTFPANRLVFESGPYTGANPFAALKWRLGEITPTNRPAFDPEAPGKYEIQAVWETPELNTFTPTVTVPGLAVKVGHTYRVRVRTQDTTGRWSHWSEPVEFTVGVPEPTAPGPGAVQVTEIMADPAGGGDFEFIELHNPSVSDPLDLTGARFTQGLEFTFPNGSILTPGGYLLVVRSPSSDHFAAFRSHYGLGTEVAIVGPFSGALNNTGESITLKSAAGTDLLSFTYGDGRGWPVAAAGTGHSLVPVEAAQNSVSDGNLNYPGHWRASSSLRGSPGQADPRPVPTVVLNEIVAHTDYQSEADSNDWIELYNLSNSAVDLGARWFLSDDPAHLEKWPIPAGSIVPPHSWIVFDEVTGFHTSPTAGFGLDKDGEQVFLSHLPGTGADRVADSARFKAQKSAWSLGRFPDGTGPWIGLTPQTRGGSNAPPPVRLTISEVMFHPQSTVSNTEDNTADEYVEISNLTDLPVALFNTNGVFRLSGGVQFLFPQNTILAPGQVLLVVNFDPATAAARETFQSAYELSGIGLIAGPYEGKLNNSSDRITLEEPQSPDQTNSPPGWVVIDEVIYSDRAPWPNADGTGLALQRISGAASGNEFANWRAAIPTPGSSSSGTPVDSDQDGMPDDWERTHGLDPISSADAARDADGDGLSNLFEHQAGTDPKNPDSVLRLSAFHGASGAARLRFEAGAHRGYVLLYCDTLSQGNWQVLKTIPAGNAGRTVELDDAVTNEARYYRVELRSAR